MVVSMKRTSVSIAVAAIFAGSALRELRAQSGPTSMIEACSVLLSSDFSHTQDAPAQITAAQPTEQSADMPAHCRVQGYVSSQIGFEVRLPHLDWNGKLLQVGCGGLCGSLSSDRGVCDKPVRSGYACIVSDMGHKGAGFLGAWAYNNLQAEIDFAYRATHVTAVIGKVIVERFYSRVPSRSYFMGCSQGGRQGLVAAQRFPWDFDGIIAGSPPVDYTANNMNLLWSLMAAQGLSSKPIWSTAAIRRLHAAVIDRCDLDDGVRDGILGNPPACHFDPAELVCKAAGMDPECLTPSQVEAAQKIYSGVTKSSGEKLYSGAARGSELNWLNTLAKPGDGGVSTLKVSRIEQFRYLSFIPDPGPGWNATDFDFDEDYKRLGMMESLYSASNPDLRRFRATGAKLIMFAGWSDELAVPGPIIDYYDTVQRTMGGRDQTQDFFRLFMLPGVNHCAGGVGADAVDLLEHLEEWVERGRAPDRILSGHLAAADEHSVTFPYRPLPRDSKQLSFTRPVFPYPLRAVYKGSGDPNDAINFRPLNP